MRHCGLLLGLVACAHTVPQDRATGPDGKQKGAVPIELDHGEGKARGIVTYPGGDRVDWKSIELPAGQLGSLDLQLTWRTPRPGLALAFDVFDQWNTPVFASASRRGPRVRSTTIDDARGTYFVRVYAPKRGDAGKYMLVARFKELKVDGTDFSRLEIPGPPRLAAVPEPDPVCAPFDVNNKACEKLCPELGAPKGWPGCKDAEARAAAEEAAKQAELARQQCLNNAPKLFSARIIHVEVVGDHVNIKLDADGERHPVNSEWTGQVLVKDTDRGLAGGRVKIIRVGKLQILASTTLTTDQVTTNPWVRLTPPPAVCP